MHPHKNVIPSLLHTALSGKVLLECATLRGLPLTVMRKRSSPSQQLPLNLLLVVSRHYRMSHNSRTCFYSAGGAAHLAPPLSCKYPKCFTNKKVWSYDLVPLMVHCFLLVKLIPVSCYLRRRCNTKTL